MIKIKLIKLLRHFISFIAIIIMFYDVTDFFSMREYFRWVIAKSK